MKIGPEHKSCRYWGYEPASAELLHKPMTWQEKKPLRDKYQAERAAIKASGRKASEMGYRTQAAAKEAALRVEAGTGIEMMVFNHDYL